MNWKMLMENTNWQRQSPDTPLFPEVLWNRPENRRFAGKLLIAGGGLHSLGSPAAAFAAAEKAGIGSARVLLPDATQKVLGRGFLEAEFAPSTPSGSFARAALAAWLENANWADGVLLAGDFGKNSETAILLESFLAKYKGPVTLSGDTVDYFLLDSRKLVLHRSGAVMVSELSKLQKLVAGKILLKQTMDLHQLVIALNKWTKEFQAAVITSHAGQIIVACQGQVSTTPAAEVDLIKLAAFAATWMIQQPEKPLETLTAAVYCAIN